MRSGAKSLVSLFLASVVVTLLPGAAPSPLPLNDTSITPKRSEIIPKTPRYFEDPPEILTSSEEENALDYSDSEADYSLEDKCSVEEFWHIRGRRCVPFKCPRANWLRDWRTGECLYYLLPNGELKSFAGGDLGKKVSKMRIMRPIMRVFARKQGLALGSPGGNVHHKQDVPLFGSSLNPHLPSEGIHL